MRSAFRWTRVHVLLAAFVLGVFTPMGELVALDLKACFEPFRAMGRAKAHVKAAVGGPVRRYMGLVTKDLDARTFVLFDRVRVDPDAKILPLDLKHLESQGALELFHQYRESARFVRELNHRIALLRRSQPGSIERPLGNRLLNRVRSVLLPSYFDRYGNRVRAIYERFIEAPHLRIPDLTPVERERIQRAGLEADLARYIADLDNYRGQFVLLSSFRQFGRRAGFAILGGAAVSTAAINQIGQKNITIEDSFNPKHPHGMDNLGTQVELVFTGCDDMPVLVRNGGNLFAFQMDGVIQMQIPSKKLDEYEWLNTKTIREKKCMQEKPHVRVGLNLSAKEAAALYDFLEEEAKRVRYKDTVLGLRRPLVEATRPTGLAIPPMIGYDPRFALAYFKARKFLGSDAIGNIYYASATPPSAGDISLEMLEDAGSVALFGLGTRALVITEVLADIFGNGNIYEDKDSDTPK